MLMHYLSGLGILLFGAVHIFTIFFTYPFQATIWETTLKFDSIPFAILPVYRNALLAASLFGLLLCTTVHAMNGLRTVIAELVGFRNKWVDRILIAVGVFLTVYGLRTILIAHLLV
ncbi:MAG: hypothetical protein RMJ28_01795 [Nitrososphaerota archaeon]|nr:hypothetical protein [Candidatus Calditenuaceae archaeon]MDW8072956.1 hypothetical protein [Nitrososphaerota archaeon]